MGDPSRDSRGLAVRPGTLAIFHVIIVGRAVVISVYRQGGTSEALQVQGGDEKMTAVIVLVNEPHGEADKTLALGALDLLNN
ncbi:hypothetical protein Landi51_13760 [Colletotrichum acutatum]